MDKRFRIFVDSIFVGAAAFDAKTGACVYVNKMATEILGADSVTLRLENLFLEDHDGLPTFNRRLADMGGFFQDTLMHKGGGEFFIANIQVQNVDELSFVTFEDLTSQKKLQRELYTKEAELRINAAELTLQNQQLRELDKAKDRFFALTSHELRTPLSSILATAQFIVDGLCNDENEVNDYVQVIVDEGQRLLEIVNDVLDFSKIQAGKLDLYVEQLPLAALVLERSEQIKNFAATKEITIRCEASNEPDMAYFDRLRMAQVIDNVLSNAVKFNRVHGKIDIFCGRAKTATNRLEIRISDSGGGIPKEFASRVFNEFETVENIHNHHKGTGLGMPICKKLIELMGGCIDFETQLGQGTTFIIQIPTERSLDEGVYRARHARSTEAA